MNNYVWIIPRERQRSFGDRGISSKYIIPKGDFSEDAGDIYGSLVWTLMRREEDRCIAVMLVKNVEKIENGYNHDDVLITCERMLSLRISKDYDGAKKYLIDECKHLKVGIHKVERFIVQRLMSEIEMSMKVMFLDPPEREMEKIDFEIDIDNDKVLADSAIRKIVETYSLEDLWSSGVDRRRGPVSNFAAVLLERKTGAEISIEMMEYLISNEPHSGIMMELGMKADEVKVNSNESIFRNYYRGVDLDFMEIIPVEVKARTRVARHEVEFDLDGVMRKIDEAEEKHQNMLRDISNYLIECGLTPYESTSIDLMFNDSGRTVIVEIKSANDMNIESQTAKGIYQLARYADALDKDKSDVRVCLLMNSVESREKMILISKIATRLGIEYLVYNEFLRWPDKVMGLRRLK